MNQGFDRRGALGALAGAGALAMPRWATAALPPFVRADTPHLTIEGRAAPGADGAVRVGYPGVVLRFVADGPVVTMRLTSSSDQTYLDVGVDDAPPRIVRLAQGPQEIDLHRGRPGKHRIEVLKRTESWQGTIDVAGFGGVRDIAPVPLPARRLLFIGDSITCGAGADVSDAASTLDGSVINDGAKSFGRVLAARLGAACHLVSYGGRGIIRDWQGIRETNNAPTFYERAMPDDAKALWDHRRYVPQAIGICLGTNDFNQGVPDQNEFVNAYVEFVRKVGRDAPDAAILVIDSPMTSDNPQQGHRRTIQQDFLTEIVAKVDRANVTHAPLARYPGRAVNVHPIASEHVAIAAELEPRFRAALPWR